jgi:hypothetical protein
VGKFTVDLDDDLHLRLKRVALEKKVSASEIVRGLLGAWLPKQEAELERLRRAHKPADRDER